MGHSLASGLSWQRVRELGQPILEPLASLAIRVGLSPNAVTLLGLAIAASSAYPIATGHLLIGGAVLLAGSFLDLLDGAVARRRGVASRFGALLDSTADRLGEGAAFLGLLLFYLWSGDSWGAALSFSAFWASVMVSYVKARAEGLGIFGNGSEGLTPRPVRVTVLAAGLLAGQPFPSLVIITTLATFTAAQRLLRGKGMAH